MVRKNVQEHMELMREAKRRKKEHINESRGNETVYEEGRGETVGESAVNGGSGATSSKYCTFWEAWSSVKF
jgi:hypothetical protein